jgi:hypothetical protein
MTKYIRLCVFIVLFTAQFFNNSNAAQTNLESLPCHPKINSKLPQYIVGYGSLMSEKSKLDTDPNAGVSIPVSLTGFQRGWFDVSKHPGFSLIYLGALIDTKSKLNGVLFKAVNAQSVSAYDLRESGYCRVSIKDKDIKILTPTTITKGEYWIYVIPKKDINFPSRQYPIVQSYVDIFLSGCFELQEKYNLNNFAKECVRTTSNWSTHWVNDRIYARRAYNEQPMISKIDNLLVSEIPKYFNAIKLNN